MHVCVHVFGVVVQWYGPWHHPHFIAHPWHRAHILLHTESPPSVCLQVRVCGDAVVQTYEAHALNRTTLVHPLLPYGACASYDHHTPHNLHALELNRTILVPTRRNVTYGSTTATPPSTQPRARPGGVATTKFVTTFDGTSTPEKSKSQELGRQPQRAVVPHTPVKPEQAKGTVGLIDMDIS
jgi:hypothetical protein